MIQRPCESINVQRCWALNFAVACLYFNHGNCKHCSGYMWLCYTMLHDAPRIANHGNRIEVFSSWFSPVFTRSQIASNIDRWKPCGHHVRTMYTILHIDSSNYRCPYFASQMQQPMWHKAVASGNSPRHLAIPPGLLTD